MHFSWLHLTDFHQGMEPQDWLWPVMEDRFYADLKRLHERCGPWDLVLFTGDLTQQGSQEEFQQVDRQLRALGQVLDELSPSAPPIFLAVPGNHDLVRPDKERPEVILLEEWPHRPEIRKNFWQAADSPYRQVIEGAFKHYSHWWQPHATKVSSYHSGMLPGDFSATFEKEGARLGLVGLNTSFRQLTEGDYKGVLALHPRQFHRACGGNGVQWAKTHHACLLMTHHPPAWLDADSREHLLNGEINDPKQQWELLSEKPTRLEKQRIPATHPEEELRLQHPINEVQTARDEIDQRLANLEGNRLAKAHRDGEGDADRNGMARLIACSPPPPAAANPPFCPAGYSASAIAPT